jgi:hypothetical protein
MIMDDRHDMMISLILYLGAQADLTATETQDVEQLTQGDTK